jgi:hypothetical protein
MFKWDARLILSKKLEESRANPRCFIQGPFEGRPVDVDTIIDGAKYAVQLDERSFHDFRQTKPNCDFCNLICYSILLVLRLPEEQLKSYQVVLQYGLLYEGSSRIYQPRTDINVYIKDPQQSFRKNTHQFLLKLEPTASEDASIFGGDYFPTDTFDWVKQCLTNCLDTHEVCHQDFDVKWLPTRLIDIGDTHSTTVKLIFSESLSSSHHNAPRYVTLSHKWGSSEFIGLRSNNLEVLKIGIGRESLPKTFLDAMQVCRTLGVRYIWIDSLCVVQDSVTDWQRESSMMDRVYRTGICNITASYGDGPYHGLELEESTDTEVIRNLRIWLPSGGSQVQYYCFNDYHSWWSRFLEQAALNQRAWVYQESSKNPLGYHDANCIRNES